MDNHKKTLMNNEDQKEIIKYLISRLDEHRSSDADRAGIVLSADSILIAGNIFLLEKMTSNQNYALILLLVSFSICLLIFSIYFLGRFRFPVSGTLYSRLTNY